MENILELQGVSKTFPRSDFTLENVTFSLPYGAILGFVGENGAGKTTTIGCILNTITKDSGTIKLFGKEMLDVFLEFVQEEDHSVLLSSHITSDLEKVADYIAFIHNGRLLMTVSKNDLVYNYAVMRCRESQFLALDPRDIIAYRKRDFQINVLVPNGKEAQRKYKGAVIDHVSVDEIMLLLIKGERV